jgi:hypothetical protein
MEVAKKISKKLAESSVVARVTYIKKYDLGIEKGLVNTGPGVEEDSEA